MTAELVDWLDRHATGWLWYAKRLSGNDTLANGTHQAGPYIPKSVLFAAFPNLNLPDVKNPDVTFDLRIDPGGETRRVRAVWYNNRLHDNPRGGRDEARVTGFGGRESPLLDPASTGALALFAFRMAAPEDGPACRVRVCRTAAEEDLVEDRIGPVEPGRWVVWPPPGGLFGAPAFQVARPCWLTPEEIPPAWAASFPGGADIVRTTVERRAERHLDPDRRLLRRRECEFEMFRSLEEAIELPHIRRGFDSIDAFVERAQTILQRRKARSGRSLELHAREIFLEEGLVEGRDFAHQPLSESGKRPDFLFPSEAAYRDPAFPADRLRMLAVKTTCRDRWRQILNEADRVREKHLLTLQEGVSEAQYAEMRQAGVRLVVPAELVGKYPAAVRGELVTLAGFVGKVRGAATG